MQVARVGPEEWFPFTIPGWLDPFSRSLSLSWEKLRNVFASVQATFALWVKGEKQSTSFSDFSGPESGPLMSRIKVSFLHPSSQELRAQMPMCPPFSHIPNSCGWNFSFHQRPDAVTCSPCQETPVNVMLPNQVKECLWVSFKGILSKLWRIVPSSDPRKCLSHSSLTSFFIKLIPTWDIRLSFLRSIYCFPSVIWLEVECNHKSYDQLLVFCLALVKFLWKSPSSLVRVKKVISSAKFAFIKNTSFRWEVHWLF